MSADNPYVLYLLIGPLASYTECQWTNVHLKFTGFSTQIFRHYGDALASHETMRFVCETSIRKHWFTLLLVKLIKVVCVKTRLENGRGEIIAVCCHE